MSSQSKYKKYESFENILHRNDKIIIPDSIIDELIRGTHEIYGHIGTKKVFLVLNESFFYKKLRHKIAQVLRLCEFCLYNKTNQKCSYAKLENITCSAPHELLSVDFYGLLPMSTGGVEHIFVTIDAFSKFVAFLQ